MSEWVAKFEVTGMTTSGIEFPEHLEIDNDMFFQNFKPKLLAGIVLIRYKESKREKEKPLSQTKGYINAKNRLLNFVSLFSLWPGLTPSFEEKGAQSISQSEKLEIVRITLGTMSVSVPPEKYDEYSKRDYEIIHKFKTYFLKHEPKLEESYLKNALRYLYYGHQTDRIEEKIIDFFIGLESLVGAGSELRYRMSIRIGILLADKIQGKTPFDITMNINRLYRLRNDVVHGRNPAISYKDVAILENSLRELIMTFLRLLDYTTKDEILDLLDYASVDCKRNKKLKTLMAN